MELKNMIFQRIFGILTRQSPHLVMVFGVVTFDDKIFAIGGGPYPGITTTNVDKIYKIDG
jgi:hypothetical protein